MSSRHLITTVGGIEIPRRYYACRRCRAKQTPWDCWAGIDHLGVTPHARRLVVTVSTAWSFDKAAVKLAELCHIKISDDTIERVCQHEGEAARRWLREGQAVAEKFKASKDQTEFYSDGLKINTTDGWREMRLNLLQKRPVGVPVPPGQWGDRVLPDATMRLASCVIADSRLTGAMWQHWSRRMGIENAANLSVIADGAPWIWEQARVRLSPQASWCVDVYHVSEHIHAAARLVQGEGDAARAWADEQLQTLIRVGGPKYIQGLEERIAGCTEAVHRDALSSLHHYLAANRDRMWYADRLREGKTIGSGAIEGACKKIGTRLKLNNARWRPRRAERFGALMCLDYTDQMDAFWASRAA